MTTTDLELIAPDARSMPAAEAAPPRNLTVIEHAIRSGATPERLQALLELQVQLDEHQLKMMREKLRLDEEGRRAAGLLAFQRDFAAFRGENITIPKNKCVDRGKAGSFMQAEFHTVMLKLSPALARHGFGLRHDMRFGAKPWPLPENPNNVIGWVWVTCFLGHRDGHTATLELEGPPGDLPANTDVQNMQVTASYLKRQSALAITGTPTGGEDDENNIRRSPPGGPVDDAQAKADANVLQAGRDAAMSGMAELTAWWGALTAKQRSAHNKDFAQLRRAAQQADQGVTQ